MSRMHGAAASHGGVLLPSIMTCACNRDPGLSVGAELVIKGDSKIRCIAAASIIAKVTRDRMMVGGER